MEWQECWRHSPHQCPLFYKKVQLIRRAAIILYKNLYAWWNLDILQIKVMQDPICDIDFLDGTIQELENIIKTLRKNLKISTFLTWVDSGIYLCWRNLILSSFWSWLSTFVMSIVFSLKQPLSALLHAFPHSEIELGIGTSPVQGDLNPTCRVYL